jgi:2-polyprenyl-6-methoxyphenol hydroxylase-like FAD-dependent oxidoreductase
MRGTAAIVGGGIGGLAAAAALHRAGWAVTLFEREPGLSGAGTALGMWPSALAALDALGVGDRVRTAAAPQTRARFLRPDGSAIGTIDARRMARRTGDPVYLLSRPALLELLRAAAPAPALRFGEPVGRVAPLRADFDVVVAADGIFSGTRAELFGDRYPARYAGVTAWRGWLDDRPVDELTEVWGRASKFGVTPMEGGRTNWYATVVAPERAFSPGREADRVRELFGAWGGPVGDVAKSVTEPRVLRHDLYTVGRLPSHVAGNVVLIGDAAHAMAPDLGRGACEALIDAVALARYLAGESTVDGALRRYDRQRRPLTQRIARTAAAASALTKWEHALAIRDAVLRLALLVPPAS